MLETTPEVNGNREAASLNELLHKDGKKIVRVAHRPELIILFDDIEFERNDYEVLSPKQRKQLISELGKTRLRTPNG